LLYSNVERHSTLCNFSQHSPLNATGVLPLLLGAMWRVASPIFLKPIPLSILMCGAFWLGIGSAVAQQACDKRTKLLDHLKRKYEEAPTALGVANNGGLVELLKTEEGKTWTLIITLPNGMTCLLAAGEDWEDIPVAQFGEKT